MSVRHLTTIESKRGFAGGFRRGVVALVLALFTLGWLAERAHFAFETHEFCAEHQRVEHVSDRVHAEAAQVHDEHARGPAFEAVDAASGDHAACCTLLGRGDDPIALASSSARVFPAVAPERPPLSYAWGTSSRASLEIVRFAPKQSPPAV